MRTLALPHGLFDWIQWSARSLSLLWAGFWTVFCVGSAIVTPAEFIIDIATALVFCTVTFCAWRHARAGGLLLAAVAVIDFLVFRVYSRPFNVWLVFTAPPLLAGILFVVHSRAGRACVSKGLLLVLALGSASASTIVATVNCDGSIVSDPTLAQCSSLPFANAKANVYMAGPIDFFVYSEANAGPSDLSSASASLYGAYLFTVSGPSSGGGFFLPCIYAGEGGIGGGGPSSASFGGYSISGASPQSSLCSLGISAASPFIYNVGQPVEISMFADVVAAGGPPYAFNAWAGLGGPGSNTRFLFWDSQGNPLSNVSFTLTEIPEPGGFVVLGVGFLMLALLWHRLNRKCKPDGHRSHDKRCADAERHAVNGLGLVGAGHRYSCRLEHIHPPFSTTGKRSTMESHGGLVMISVRQVHFVEEHWEAIAKRALGRIRREIPQSHSFSDAMILDRVQDLFGHLGDWLTVSNQEQMGRYEQFGRRRAGTHVELHDLVRMLQIIRQCAVDYARDNELSENTVALRCESDLEYGIDRFFDLVIYNVVKGYEAVLKWKPEYAAAN